MEGKSNAYLLGLAAGIAVGLLAWFLFRGKLRHQGKDDADERQLLVRGKAYQIGFFLYMAELAVLMLLEGLKLWVPFTSGALYVLTLLIPIGFYAVYCVFHDAYLGIHAKWKNFLALGLFLCLIEGIGTVGDIRSGEMVVNGQLTGKCINPGVAVLWLVILAALMICRGQNAREDQE